MRGGRWAAPTGGAINGRALLLQSLFWGSTLDATSPDRVVDVLPLMTVGSNCTRENGVAGPDGSLTAIRLRPTPGAYTVQDQAHPKLTASAAIGAALTDGVRTQHRIVLKGEDTLTATLGARGWSNWEPVGYLAYASPMWSMSTAGAVNSLGFTDLRTFPDRQIAQKNADGWGVFLSEAAFSAAGHLRPFLRVFNEDTAATIPAQCDGLLVAEWKAYQSPLATLPNKATGGAVASVDSEVAAPLLERPLAMDQQYAGAWSDATRALRFLGIAGQSVSLSGAAALSGTDHDWSVTLTWWPTVHPDADSAVWSFSGPGSGALKLEHTASGLLKLTRTADDGSTISATFDRMVGLVPHSLTVQVSGGVASVYSQGVKWGASKAFASGKVATLSTGKLGGSGWLGLVAEWSVSARAYSDGEVSAIHSELCARRNLPTGARETWLINGQSNSLDNGLGYQVTGQSKGFLSACGGVHADTSNDAGVANYSGWGPVRYFGTDRRKSNGNNPYNCSNGNFASYLFFHAQRHNIATIRHSRGGIAVSGFLPGGAEYENMMAGFSASIANAGVPLNVRGVLFVNAEGDTTAVDAPQHAARMDQLFSILRDAFASNPSAFIGISRKLPWDCKATSDQAPYVPVVRDQQVAWAAEDPTRRALIVCDDDQTPPPTPQDWWPDYPTNIHGGTLQRVAEGQRFAAAVAAKIG